MRGIERILSWGFRILAFLVCENARCDISAELFGYARIFACRECARLGRDFLGVLAILGMRECDNLAELFQSTHILACWECARLGRDFFLGISHSRILGMRECGNATSWFNLLSQLVF